MYEDKFIDNLCEIFWFNKDYLDEDMKLKLKNVIDKIHEDGFSDWYIDGFIDRQSVDK